MRRQNVPICGDACAVVGSSVLLLGQQKGGYAMSLNGFIGEEDRRIEVPQHLYDEELLIDNGVSALRQLNGMTTPRLKDALYLRLR